MATAISAEANNTEVLPASGTLLGTSGVAIVLVAINTKAAVIKGIQAFECFISVLNVNFFLEMRLF